MIERRAKIPSRLQKLLLAGQILKNTENLQEVLAETPVGEITLIRTDKWIEEAQSRSTFMYFSCCFFFCADLGYIVPSTNMEVD